MYDLVEDEETAATPTAPPDYESLKLPSDYEQVGSAALKTKAPMKPSKEDYEVMGAAPMKQAEKELRSYEEEVKPKAVENPYEVEPTEKMDVEDFDDDNYTLL